MRKGFTLAELLIALAILGVIATFTIPKVLQSQSDGKYKAIAKENIAAISGAFQAYVQEKGVTSETWTYDLLPYINYVSSSSLGSIDDVYGGDDTSCNAWNSSVCLKMHNGSVLWVHNCKLTDTSTTHGWEFKVDPDGVYGGNQTGPGKSLSFLLFANGRILDTEAYTPGTNFVISSCGWWDPDGIVNPPWFSWN